MDRLTLARAQGCLAGQLAGDALGSLVEFRSADSIRREYPEGVRLLADGGTWNTIAGQPTDDSEMALMLARSLVKHRDYASYEVWDAYRSWIGSDPFDCGSTVAAGLNGFPNPESQANGALMRISPLGIFGSSRPDEILEEWAKWDARMTHPHPICVEANVLFAQAIALAVRNGMSGPDLYEEIRRRAILRQVPAPLLAATEASRQSPPNDFLTQQGWVLIAWQNALWHLLHTESLEEAVVATVMSGGDTDTNAAICGALLGSVYGIDALPQQWVDRLSQCRPERGRLGVHRPRPECFWPHDFMSLAEGLLAATA
jgi:ADP-ribosyl-[dinitrogen reductase] hydrolase